MATKKKKASPKAAAKKVAKRKRARPCVPPEICKYLAELNTYFIKFQADYEALRIAMCNVEQEAFTGTGVAGKRFPKCGGGTGGDPTPPPKPPVWE